MSKKKKATIPATSGTQPPALKIGSRVRCDDGTGGRITWANAVSVKIKYADFQQATRSRTLPAIVTSQDTLRNVSIGLVRTVFPPAKGIRLVGNSFEL